MMASFPSLSLQHGRFYLEGKPRLLVTADYPYYRDDARNWHNRLAALKSLGVAVITAYLPWRHHQPVPETPPDFAGRSAPNRNVLGFLALCQQLELLVILKPGPFIHAEVNYGGLPDWVCPLFAPIEPIRDDEDRARLWSGAALDAEGKRPQDWPLPAPFDPLFRAHVERWMLTVHQEVLKPFSAPHGPIVTLQIGNEGLYSDGQAAPWSYDYSASGLEQFRRFLQAKYLSLPALESAYGKTFADWQAIQPPRRSLSAETPAALLQDWGEFQAWYLAEVFRRWAEPLRTSLPILLNQNPPLDAPYGLDAWLTRIEPERWEGLTYGFTNWVGDVSANASAFHRYTLAAKRFPGPNMEENWGFSQLYDPAYRDAATSFYQTLLALNNGATAFNVYTAVSTAHADRNIELIPGPPYPDAAPIRSDGTLTPKAETVRWLAQFFAHYGEEFLDCRPFQHVAWGLYLPHVRLSVWSPHDDPGALQHGRYLAEFQRQMRHLHLDYALLNLETASAEELAAYRFLLLPGGERMAVTVQVKLAEYLRRGGKLVVLERIPRLDESGARCEILWQERANLLSLPAGGYKALLGALPRPRLLSGQADIWVRSHPQRDLYFVTLLIPAHGTTLVEALLPLGERWQRLALVAAAAGGALLRIENGQLTDALIKGWNAYLGSFTTPRCLLDTQQIALDAPADLLWLNGERFSLLPEMPEPREQTP